MATHIDTRPTAYAFLTREGHSDGQERRGSHRTSGTPPRHRSVFEGAERIEPPPAAATGPDGARAREDHGVIPVIPVIPCSKNSREKTGSQEVVLAATGVSAGKGVTAVTVMTCTTVTGLWRSIRAWG
jgi:hypothetical protein